VVVAVGGTPRDGALLQVALGWAERLSRPLVIATVAEPAPSYHEGSQRRRVVVGAGHHHGLTRMVLGTHAARVVHDAPVPALVVPRGGSRHP
jgi:hypothetical protein